MDTTKDTYTSKHGKTIVIDYTRDNLFDENGIIRLKESYMLDSEKSPQERFAFVACRFASDADHAQRLYDYASKHWLSFATPILSYGRSKYGLPISCFLTWLPDTANGLVDTLSETNWLSMVGGGVGIGLGIRAADEKSTGVMPHLQVYNYSSLAYRQGKTRRGTYAPYLDISHPDIRLFIEMRKKTGDINIRCRELHHGVNIPDSFMEIIERCMKDEDANDDWPLIDPASGEVREIVSAKQLWEDLLILRSENGEPYLHFIDTSNKFLPPEQKALGLKIRQSNICTEIILPTDEQRTAVCCLSSLNLYYWDEWSQPDVLPQFLEDVAEMLDNVLDVFVEKGSLLPALRRAVYSAQRERAIGIGALGLHSYMQKNMIPFESAQAVSLQHRIFGKISNILNKINLKFGEIKGEAPDMKGSGKRFSRMMAIAPNASSSIIVGNRSPSIEPTGNATRQDTMSGFFFNKNKELDELIKKKCEADPTLVYDDVWSEIVSAEGSIASNDIFTDEEKAVFKTPLEIDQRWVIELAAARQQYLDQTQSVNLFFRANASIAYIHMVHYMAWKKGLPTLYYYRSEKAGKADKLGKKIARKKIEVEPEVVVSTDEECLACAG